MINVKYDLYRQQTVTSCKAVNFGCQQCNVISSPFPHSLPLSISSSHSHSLSRKEYFIHSLTHILTTCVTCVTSITCIACINCITCITLISFTTFTIKDFYFMHYLHYLYQFPIFRAAKKSALFPKNKKMKTSPSILKVFIYAFPFNLLNSPPISMSILRQ